MILRNSSRLYPEGDDRHKTMRLQKHHTFRHQGSEVVLHLAGAEICQSARYSVYAVQRVCNGLTKVSKFYY